MTEPNKKLSELDGQLASINAQLAKAETASPTPPAPSSLPQWWSVTDAMTISAAVLVFGLVTMAFASSLLKRNRDPDALLRVLGTIMILISILFLIVAGYSSTQIAPAMGLLGTVAGYLLGKADRKKAIDARVSAEKELTTPEQTPHS